MPEGEIPRLAAELRAAVMANAADAGRRPEASLGVVELTIALQRIFDTPGDRIVFETGDLAHANEVLAARRPGGTGADFGAAQAAAAISAGLGMAVARDLRGAGNRILCVIGGGALSSGVAYEAMSGAGLRNERLVVVLADDDAGGAAEVGSLSAYLARLSSSSAYFRLRDVARQLARRLPRKWERRAARAEELTRTYWTGGTLFEELGFHYVGPIDGHDFAHLLPVLRNVRDADAGPILVHVVVERGVAGREVEAAGRAPARASVAEFARSLLVEARGDPDVVAVLSAMPDGIGLDPFRREFPARCFDAGVAAQHALAFAAGLATEGLKPFVLVGPAALRSACGQLVDDVLRRGLPVRFAVAGTGDGDEAAFAQPGGLAGMVAMFPADAAELRRMVATQVACGDGPSLLCLPRMVAGDAGDMSAREARLEVGRGRVLREGDRVALLSLGTTLGACLEAADMIAAGGLAATVADARFAMPLDVALVRRL
ncbi:MAG: 1-deoxy-D-xylulose-5-phosphate synthase N-terminal domain-containing protein, partial [Alphaproteobacteria bacterium]